MYGKSSKIWSLFTLGCQDWNSQNPCKSYQTGSALFVSVYCTQWWTLACNILRKTIEGYENSFEFITFGNLIFKQIIFVIDRIITMQFTKIQSAIHGSLVTIQYYTKCTNPLYPKFTSKKFSALNFWCNLYQVIAYALIPTTGKS